MLPSPLRRNLTAADSVADSESAVKEDDIAEETEHSSSKHSPKHSRSEEEEVNAKHTSSIGLGVEDADPSQGLNVPPLDSRPPKKQCKDAWDLSLDDDDSEYVFSSTDSVNSLELYVEVLFDFSVFK